MTLWDFCATAGVSFLLTIALGVLTFVVSLVYDYCREWMDNQRDLIADRVAEKMKEHRDG